jgi:hypothetical protein
MSALGLLFRLILWSCCLLARLPLQAQEGEGQATLHHPPQDQGYTKNSIQRGTCPTIHRLAVATTRTATRLKSSTLTETSTPNVEKTGGRFSFRPKRWNAIGIIRMDEITCAHRRPIPCARRIPYTASHWEAPHDAPSGALQSRGPWTNRHGPCRGTPEAKNMLRRYCHPALTQEIVTLGVTILVFSYL